VVVNKAQKMGKVGFGAIKRSIEASVAPQPFSAPLQKALEIPKESIAPVISEKTPSQEILSDNNVSHIVEEQKNINQSKPRGFVSLESLKDSVPVAVADDKPFVCPIDPAEREQCDSCQ
jgi:hypothetical protein